MSKRFIPINRPPVGFIVEGHGEYNCYPSLVGRIISSAGVNIPRVNVGGYGGITRNLGEQLTLLVLAHYPFHIIITIDLKDVLKDKLYDNCEELRIDLEEQAKDWLGNSQHDSRLQPLPERITIVVQIQQFESWIIADISSLNESGCLEAAELEFTNVDQDILNPAAWLRKHLRSDLDQKNPKCAKVIISCLDPNVMRIKSPSFDKFYREVLSSYDCWCQVCNISC